MLEQEESGNLKITYQGKNGKLIPKIQDLEISTINSSTEVKVQALWAENYIYYIKEINEADYTKKGENTTGAYLFENLDQSKEYKIKVEVVNENGKALEEIILGVTVSTTNWTNQPVKITLPTQSGYTAQYQIDATDGEWIEYTDKISVLSNSIVYYRYNNGTNMQNYSLVL